MDIEKAQAVAEECGFDISEKLDVSTLDYRQDVRDMCSPSLCPQGYGHSWSCPPVAPALEDLQSRTEGLTQGIIVQTIGQLEDSYDFETIMETTHKHGKAFALLAKKIAEETDGESLPLGAGACPLCSPCTYPDADCRYPERMITSMEASGLLVNDVCTKNGLLYNNGENTITFTSCCLF